MPSHRAKSSRLRLLLLAHPQSDLLQEQIFSCPPALPPLQVCLQVNVSGEASKAGVQADGLPALATAVAALPGLRLRGLMAIPEPTGDAALLRARFRTLRQLLEGLKARGLALDTLSMGMSDDFELAIAEGATLVRVGRAIFGARPMAA